MNLAEVLKKVENQEEKKSDVILNLQSTTPLVKDQQVVLKTGRNTTRPFTKTGLSSYLQKIDIPLGFFNKCSGDLKREVLSEFHAKNGKADVMLRLSEESIRFCASSKYSKYDDINILRALQEVDSPLVVKEFHQSDDFLNLRAMTEKPLEVAGLRPYYPGIQVMNSEVGRSAVKLQFCLWEEVCTNGMVIQNKSLGGFNMIHLGQDRDKKLKEGTSLMLKQLDHFVEESEKRLIALQSEDSSEFLRHLEIKGEIPHRILVKMKEVLPNYSSAKELKDASAMDAISSYTESIQTYEWDARNTYERVAGEYLWKSV